MVNSACYRQQVININHALITKRSELAQRQKRDFAIRRCVGPHHKSCRENFKRIELAYATTPLYSPDITPLYYYLFQSMAHELTEW